jgi:hypothetical protein
MRRFRPGWARQKVCSARNDLGAPYTSKTTTVIPLLPRPRSKSPFSSGLRWSSRQLSSSEVDQFSPKMHPRISPVSTSSRKRFCTAIRISPPAPVDPYPWTIFRKWMPSRRARASSWSRRCRASETCGRSCFRLTVLMALPRSGRQSISRASLDRTTEGGCPYMLVSALSPHHRFPGLFIRCPPSLRLALIP